MIMDDGLITSFGHSSFERSNYANVKNSYEAGCVGNTIVSMMFLVQKATHQLLT